MTPNAGLGNGIDQCYYHERHDKEHSSNTSCLTPATGATTAIHDAIVLANYLSTLKTNEIRSITSLFQQYQDERAPLAKDAVAASASMSKLVGKVTESPSEVKTSLLRRERDPNLPYTTLSLSFFLDLVQLCVPQVAEQHAKVALEHLASEAAMLPSPDLVPPTGKRPRIPSSLVPKEPPSNTTQESSCIVVNK